MSIFSVERPVSTQETMENMIRANAERQANLALLREQMMLEAEEAEKQEKMLAQDKAQQEQEKRQQAMESAMQAKRLADSRRAVAEATLKLPGIARESIIRKALFDITMESLWIDDEVKNTPELRCEALSVFNNMVDKCDKITGKPLMTAMENTKLLSCINDIATYEGSKIAERILTEAAETDEISINFRMNTDEINEIDRKMGDLGTKELAKEIKKKVLKVVEDEKESGKVKAELFAELDDASKEEEEEPETTDVGGEGSTASDTGTEDVSSENSDESTTESLDELRLRLIRENANRKLNSMNGSSVFESIMMRSLNDVDSEHATLEGSSLLDSERNNAALLQTILEYTVLETFNTLKIYDFNLRNIGQVKKM